MKKYLVLFLLTSSCTHIIIDPRGSKEPREIVRDEIECKKIIKDHLNFVDRFFMHERLIKNCLRGRGHSILN